MCLKKILNWLSPEPDPVVPMQPVQQRLLTFGKNKYGGGNDLNGCVNDSKNLSADFKKLFPDADIKMFLDYEVTASTYKSKLAEAIKTLSPGATVVIIADSCYSQSVTKKINGGHEIKNRFFDPGLPERPRIRTKMFRHKGMNVIEISGSLENETSADVYADGQYQGALTCIARKVLKSGITYRQWYEGIAKLLPGNLSDQHPQISGPDNLLDRKIGEGQMLWCHNSSHGTYNFDASGDEADGRDEGLYFDKFLSDDEIALILQGIPA